VYLQFVSSDDEWGRWVLETYSALRTLQKSGCRIVWTAHNLFPHKQHACQYANELLQQSIAALADGVIHHSDWGMSQIAQTYAFTLKTVHRVIPFAPFPDEAPPELTKSEARGRLGLPQDLFVLLNVGAVTQRKRLDLIAEAVGQFQSFPVLLIVVGSCSNANRTQLIRTGAGRVRFAGQLKGSDLAIYARAADSLVFAPYSDQLTSGGPHLSASFLLPQLTTDTPYVREVLAGHAYYYEPTVVSLMSAIQNLHDQWSPGVKAQYTQEMNRWRSECNWVITAGATHALYEEVLSQSVGDTKTDNKPCDGNL
jgi:glycosyltransferase involved in cell wall biosynthesis